MTSADTTGRRRTWVDLPAARPAGDAGVAEAIGAGFTHAGPDSYPEYGAAAFEAGGAADVMPPCSVLAELTGQALEAGLERLTDDELVGVLRAARRVVSWQSAVELAAVEELVSRRRAEGADAGPRPDERAAAEVAAALTLTRRAAEALTGVAYGVVRLPEVASALAAGEIDLARATVFAEELAGLGWLRASFIGGMNLLAARGMTTTQLRALLRREVLAADPGAGRKRQQAARADARVQSWSELSGNGALAGRELPAAQTLLADKHVGALAMALKAAGMPGTLDQIRAEVFLALLSGQSPGDLLSAAGVRSGELAGVRSGEPAGGPHGDLLRVPDAGGLEPVPDAEDLLPGLPPTDLFPCLPWDEVLPGQAFSELPGRAGFEPDDLPSRAGFRPGHLLPGGRPVKVPSWPSGPLGTVHLTIPWTTWLGLSDRPAEVAGHGPIDAWTGRELAGHLRGSGGTRYCVTVTTDDGHPLAHACADSPPPASPPPRSGTGPPGTGPLGTGPPGAGPPPAHDAPGPATAWIAGLNFEWLSSGSCDHSRQTTAYRPTRSLDHLIKIRNPTCTAPGCRRPSWQCDIDHVVPFHLGGRTCECNCHPACRRDHRCKGSTGWHLDMLRPGTLAWRLPHGRTYITTAEPYPV